ncbi:glycosyltransferase family 4 protein [Enterococcus dispar]|jgi:1,2-diacylglycerol-3-alpha-glucose alpha-1,2-galactosyltransferase|uniref:Glycosyl transferase n=1 Tax=Enterococcus dispar ATCC 51266 TaxID=1139219 RepID=S0KPS7_9ENTE|nr:glycosyltransferase family 4 protein [Enterococcus dispar]EOT41211.1 hypothetical protein OMK_01381 [Enterococcus dispar ATCC 51266]EOW87155.1 hypothetical protein I569_02525 [Enterococcus dispar ATCC 51266]MCU7356577.1 glycosyltransferase family 4 protein [Enterococcus dispar]MDT2704444.1 glycosyltransferase family 4 protein [Enterococcus dispar]OJG38348.1 hypothetical protein RV01_GL002578 [Enterococcus dispar]
MIKIAMFSRADTVKGQGVGSAYNELIKMLKERFNQDFDVRINEYKKSDISHYHTINPEFYLSTFFKKQRGVTIGYVHFLPETLEGSIHLAKPIQKIFNWYVLSFYRRMDKLVVVNPSFIPELIKAGIPAEKISYIPNFVSAKEFYQMTPEKKDELRQKYQIPLNKFVVLGVGQIQKRKGVDDFIRLAKENPEVSFIWVGGFSFGKITDGYEEYKEVYENPPANLTFTGIIDRSELVNYYNLADIFLLPSYNELFPMSILEAFSCQTPVMVRNLDLYEAVISGYYLGADDFAEMNRDIKALQTDSALLKKYASLAHEASNYYSEAHVGEIWYDFYTGLLKKEITKSKQAKI